MEGLERAHMCKRNQGKGVGMGVIGNADISGDNTEAIVRIVPDLVGSRRASTAIVECDITESGMGTRSNACKIVAEVLNVPVEKVSITEPGSKFNRPTTVSAVPEAPLPQARQYPWQPWRQRKSPGAGRPLL